MFKGIWVSVHRSVVLNVSLMFYTVSGQATFLNLSPRRQTGIYFFVKIQFRVGIWHRHIVLVII